ncbi:diguanylate cyclase (GGDEF) domain-containing protein [Terribacillus halophilus]|uniref:Diguanylate cyclase (GGDEF) domain-containing protein n=1 Tax=Terribacillus halophilus TaxID=361279 RepID=A0A1G6SFL1_9BACI|nr:sensor domain-containing diguanylate cyclase [Terribacillus halophilus]SDD15441.1 diguanylate cyclase (GGDEF) domain-containing protein [Terribacillus halophilus]
MVNSSEKRWIWAAWAIIWPASLYSIYQQTNLDDLKWLDLGAFTALAIIVALFPIMVNQIPVFFLNGITLVIYLNFGLFVELIITTVSVTIVLLQVRMTREDLFRIPLNYVMFLLMSVSAAGIYSLFDLPGNAAQALETPMHIVGILAYSLTLFLMNHLLITLTRIYIYGMRDKIFERSFFWEFMTTFYILPAALLLHLLYHKIGPIAVVFIGFSIASTSYILRLYYRSRSMNEHLRLVSEIGHDLTARLNVKETLDLFMERIVSLVPVDQAYLYDVTNRKDLKLIRLYDPKERSFYQQGDRKKKEEGIAGSVWRSGTGVRYGKRKQWIGKWKETAPSHSESLMCLPIERDNQIIGILVLLSEQRNIYEKYQFMLVDLLANFMAVSLLNAYHYEQTKQISERCPLTGLYNYRYFENALNELFQDMSEHTVSLIMIDLDHFKKVNDTYGHEAGNDVLREVAERLRETVGKEAILARYGGEEFAVILPHRGSCQAAEIADSIQRSITAQPFVTKHTLDKGQKVALNVTASIGVATYPENSEDALELVRHAYRAMYVGAKQKGRNRVSIYHELQQTTENIPL